MTEDVFGSDQGQREEGQDATLSNNPHADLLASIVNEEGVQKYKSIEDALEGLRNSQEFIGKLKEENQTYRSELDKRLSAEQVLKELKAATKPDEKPSTEFSTEAIQELVDKRLEAKTVEQRMKQNETVVQQTMLKEFGEKANEIVKGKAKELGLSSEGLRKLSQESPAAVLAMFGLAPTKHESVTTKLHSSVNTEASPSTETRTYQWYQKLRRENESQYRTLYPQMLRDAERMGEGFYK